MNPTNIEYLDYGFSPIAMRCAPCSPGCENCWHLTRCDMFKNNPIFSKEVREIYAGDRPPKLIESRLNDPLKRKKPGRIGLQFMGDLFHDDISINSIHIIWDLMKACPQHTFVILTKRPVRMKECIDKIYSLERLGAAMGFWKHVWIGVTVCNQEERWKIDELRKIPAAVRFVSFEPLLEDMGEINFEGIGWTIVGGETGPGARPMKPQWAKNLRDQCQSAGVPFFFKKHGSWFDNHRYRPDFPDDHGRLLDGKIWEQYPV